MTTNIPPGTRMSDCSADAQWETFHEWIDSISAQRRLRPDEARVAFEMGLAAFDKVKPQLAAAERYADDLAWGNLKWVNPNDIPGAKG
jgi:hypothetical protein